MFKKYWHVGSNMSERDNVARKVTVIGAFVNVILAGLKAFVGIITSSASLIADAVHSIADLISDFVVYIAILFGSREADENHQYGHRRYETIASMIVGFLIIATGLGLGWEFIQRIQESDTWANPGRTALIVAGVSLIAKEILYQYTHKAGVRHNHQLIQANAIHHRTDALSSLVVFAGLLVSELGYSVGDLAAALIVAFMLTRIGMKIVYESLLEISEAGVDSDTYILMESTIRDTDGVVDMHLLRTKTIGGEIYAETHAQVNPYLSVTQGHEIAHRIIKRVENVVPALKELTVHIDPEDDEHVNPELPDCSDVESKIKQIWSTIHEAEDLEFITLHVLYDGIEADLRISSKVPETHLEEIKSQIASIENINKVQFLSLR